MDDILISKPDSSWGYRLNKLVEACPPLDSNSVYANLLQFDHFRKFAAMATAKDRLLGSVTGYAIPDRPDVLFVWQVAVHQDARGKGLAGRMIMDILGREENTKIQYIETTITGDNSASYGLFRKLAAKLNSEIAEQPYFISDKHFNGEHSTENLVRIGPFKAQTTVKS